MARLNLPLSKAELRATGDLPQLSYDEQVVFSPYLPQNKYAFRKGGRWSGILRLGTQHDPAAITAIDAWLDQLATQENSTYWPLALPTVDTTLPGSLAISALYALQGERLGVRFATMTTAQMRAKIPLGAFVRLGQFLYKVISRSSGTAYMAVVPGYKPQNASVLQSIDSAEIVLSEIVRHEQAGLVEWQARYEDAIWTAVAHALYLGATPELWLWNGPETLAVTLAVPGQASESQTLTGGGLLLRAQPPVRAQQGIAQPAAAQLALTGAVATAYAQDLGSVACRLWWLTYERDATRPDTMDYYAGVVTQAQRQPGHELHLEIGSIVDFVGQIDPVIWSHAHQRHRFTGVVDDGWALVPQLLSGHLAPIQQGGQQ